VACESIKKEERRADNHETADAGKLFLVVMILTTHVLSASFLGTTTVAVFYPTTDRALTENKRIP
jgi:hypothetical protein